MHMNNGQNARANILMTESKREDHDGRQMISQAADILDPNNQIGVKLRSLYSAAQEEGIPDRILDLLEKLDQVERLSSAKSGQ